METRTEDKPKRTSARGRTVPNRLPKMVTHVAVAESFGVSAETIRRWATAEPPLFLRPQSVMGQFLFFREKDVIALIDSGEWHHPAE